MAARTFQDAAGTEWEVFEVRRASNAPRGVSAGLEKGWLAFVSRNGKRRLAQYPTSWQQASETDLQRMCEAARASQPARFPSRGGRDHPNAGPGPSMARLATAMTEASDDDPENPVRATVGTFAREARAAKMPAVAALLRLKALLLERFPQQDDETSRREAPNMRQVRRWFVEAFYFERDNQSR